MSSSTTNSVDAAQRPRRQAQRNAKIQPKPQAAAVQTKLKTTRPRGKSDVVSSAPSGPLGAPVAKKGHTSAAKKAPKTTISRQVVDDEVRGGDEYNTDPDMPGLESCTNSEAEEEDDDEAFSSEGEYPGVKDLAAERIGQRSSERIAHEDQMFPAEEDGAGELEQASDRARSKDRRGTRPRTRTRTRLQEERPKVQSRSPSPVRGFASQAPNFGAPPSGDDEQDEANDEADDEEDDIQVSPVTNHTNSISLVYPAPGTNSRLIRKSAQVHIVRQILKKAGLYVRGSYAMSNPFPPREVQDREVTVAVIQACTALQRQDIAQRYQTDLAYQVAVNDWVTDSANHHRTAFRFRVPEDQVLSAYSLDTIPPGAERSLAASRAMTSLWYVHPITNVSNPAGPGGALKKQPYQHVALVRVVSACFFQGENAISRLHAQNFPTFVDPAEPGLHKVQLPNAMIAFAATIIWSRLKDIAHKQGSTTPFSAANYRDEYLSNVTYLENITAGTTKAGKLLKWNRVKHQLYQDASILASNFNAAAAPEQNFAEWSD